MDDALRTQIILAAVATAGPAGEPGWQARVAEQAGRITALTHEKSPVAKLVEQVAVSKVFPASIVKITKEESSTRGFVTLKTSPSKLHPDGVETARTERTDNPAGKAMAKRIQELKGHRVLLWVEVQEYGDGAGKVRVIRHVEDLGVDPSTESA